LINRVAVAKPRIFENHESGDLGQHESPDGKSAGREPMPAFKITIKGPSENATCKFDDHTVPLTRRGRTYKGQVNTGSGKHSYVIVVFGHEGEKWEASVESPSAKNKHMGHMSPGGWDTSNTTSIEV
jgi:hypothetical protein